MRVLAEIGVGGVDGQRCVTLVRLVSHTVEDYYSSPPSIFIYIGISQERSIARACMRLNQKIYIREIRGSQTCSDGQPADRSPG